MRVITHWLYYMGQPIYAVRLSDKASSQEALQKALFQHERVPLCYPEAPYVFRYKILNSTIRQFETVERKTNANTKKSRRHGNANRGFISERLDR